MTNHSKGPNVLLITLAGVFIFMLGYSFRSIASSSIMYIPDTNGKKVNFETFWAAWNTLNDKYVHKDTIDDKKRYYGAIKGMVASLNDPYTYFLTPEELKREQEGLKGNFQGIGAVLDQDKENKLISVVKPLPNSPAEKAGLKKNDIIYKVDDVLTSQKELQEVISSIRGPEGTTVKLTIVRQGEQLDIKIKREVIVVPTLELSYTNDIAHIVLNQFGDKTNSEWDKAINEVKNKYDNKQVRGLVLDLRNNPGGYLQSAVYLASEFLPVGSVVVDQKGEYNETYKVERKGSLLSIPLTVLINGSSASASEILSGALKDYKRAVIVGEKSFGKGSVQRIVDLPEGTALHMTVAKWLLPNGDWINEKGIEPDIKVLEPTREADLIKNADGTIVDIQYQKAVETIK